MEKTEEILISKWRKLPFTKKQQVIDFVSFLESNYSSYNQELSQENYQESLKGKVIYYHDPYESVALDDWEVIS